MGEGDYYTRIHANYEKAKAEYERAEKLVKDQIVSQKEFENARLNYQNAKTAYEAISGKQSAKGVGITTPLTGYLKNISVKDGEYVTAGQAIATVSQNQKINTCYTRTCNPLTPMKSHHAVMRCALLQGAVLDQNNNR